MKIVLTGTGTSQGVPVIGCRCTVCLSDDPRDKRLRTAAFLQSEETNVAIDAGPDFRQQMLGLVIDHLDALVLTHEHNDHVAGLDDIRPFNFLQKKPLKVFALPSVIIQIRDRFKYIFAEESYPGAPKVEFHEVVPNQTIEIGRVKLLPFTVTHGAMLVLGFRTGTFVYITDANGIPKQASEIIDRADIMVINALHHKPHHSHFNVNQAIAQAQKHHIKKTFLTHISHQMGKHAEVNAALPPGIALAFDQLQFQI